MRTFILFAALAIASCDNPPAPPNQTDVNDYVTHTCDEYGRAIYWTGYSHGGVFVIDKAPECERFKK